MNTKILILVSFFFLHLSIHGQIEEETKKINVDSLQQILPGLDGVEKIIALNKISFAIARDQTDSSISLANRTIFLSEVQNYPKGIADANLNLGISYLYLDSIKNSVIHLLDALRIYEDIDTCWEMGIAMKQLQGINFYTGKFNKSKAYGRKAAKVFGAISEHNYKVRVLVLQALAYTENQEFDSASYYNNLALAILDKYPDPHARASIYFDQGYNLVSKDTIINKELVQQALTWYLEALKLSESINDTDIICLSLYNAGYSYWVLGSDENVIKGKEYNSKAMQILKKIKIRTQLLIATYKRQAWIEYYDGNYHKAIELLLQGLNEGKSRMSTFSVSDYPDPINVLLNKYYYYFEVQRSYASLIHMYKIIGNFELALKYSNLERKASEIMLHLDNNNLIAMLEAESENDKTEKKISLLERDKEINELKVAQSRYFSIGVGVLFIVSSLIGILFIRQNRLKNEHKSTLLEQKLLRLQMNPHFIFNSLANIQDFIWNKDPLTANEYLSSFSKLVRLTLENSRSDFVTVEKEISIIENYLNLQKLRHKDKFIYTIHVDPEIDEENMQIPPMLVQPFIENSIEHGISAKETVGHIDVKFLLNGNQIDIDVRDDGVGFKKSAALKEEKMKDHQSLAISITQERLLMHYKKYKRKIQLNISELTDDNNNVMGAQVLFEIPYTEV